RTGARRLTAALGTKVAAAAPVIPNFGGGGTCVRQNKLFCWDWFSAHWGDTFQPALLDHIKLTLIAVGIGFAISFVAALVAYRFARFETPFSGFSGILAGVQVATVTVISLATIAAFIVDQGLGSPIFKAIPTTFNTEFIAAGALTTGLALAAYLLIAVAQRLLTPWARRARPA